MAVRISDSLIITTKKNTIITAWIRRGPKSPTNESDMEAFFSFLAKRSPDIRWVKNS